MSGSTIGGVVGGAIGFYFGGPQGAQIGWMIGSAVGGYVDPEKIQGPRLTDAVRQTAQDGVPIPFGYGTFPTTGNIIWVQPGPPTEHRSQQRTGKGGPVQVTYTYTRSYAIGICEGEISGLLLIKRNGKLVYDARTDAELLAAGMTTAQLSASRAASAAFLAKCTVYTGTETQVADPTIEAWQGVGNVPGHRGMAYIVVHDDDVTLMDGAIPQYEFVVSVNGALGEATGNSEFVAVANTGTNAMSFGSGDDWPGPYIAPPTSVRMLSYIDGVLVGYNGTGVSYYSLDRGDTWTATLNQINSDCQVAQIDTAKWCMVGDGFSIFTTTNGVGWTDNTITGSVFGALTCVGGHRDLVVVGDNAGYLKKSTNQAADFDGAAGPYIGPVTAISRSHNEIHAVVCGAQDGGMVYWNDTTNSWDAISTPFTAAVSAIFYADNRYVATCLDGQIGYSDNGFTWFVADFELYGRDVIYANGLWIAAGNNVAGESSPTIAYSTDGENWTYATDSFSGDFVRSVSVIPCSGTEVPDAPGWFIDASGELCGPTEAPIDTAGVVLSEIVADLFDRIGIPAAQYDVSQLTDVVTGYRIASEGGVDAYVAPLMQAYFFDVGEWDGKLRCIKRGGSSALSLTVDDLAEKDGDAIEQTRVQEAELLRKQTVGYLDPAALYTTMTQQWERRSATVQAKGEGSIAVPVVMDGDTAAQVAEKRGKVAWSETDKFKFCLPYRRAKLTPTDVVTLYDFDGNAHRMRVMGVEEDSGVLHIEAAKDRQAAYTGTATGIAPETPTIPGPALIGPTQLVVMDLPVLRDQDDALGLYVAGRGYFSAWTGGQVQVSTEGTYAGVAEITTPSTIGYTVTDFAAGTQDTTDTQSLTVWLPDAPETVDYATLLRYSNRAAIQSDSGSWEVIQFQTVTALGDDFYTLSGIVRGRYNTAADAAGEGATFVLIDSTLQFVPVERWTIGETLSVRAVSYGTDADAATAQSVPFTDAASQTEWPPVEVSATRDGSDNVTVDWVGRARLGTETSPHQSQFFDGYRVTYSDGVDSFSYDVDRTGLIVVGTNVVKAEVTTHTYTAAMQTSDFGSVPGSLTVTVSALNLITGASAPSDSITV